MKKIKVFAAIDYILLACVICLTLIGVAFIYSAAINRDGVLTNTNYLKQILWGSTGLVFMIVIACYDYRKTERYIFWIFVGACIVLLYTAFFGRYVNGSRSWIGFGAFSIQPAEFCKVIFIVFLAWYLNNSENENPLKRFTVCVSILALMLGLIMLQPDLGTALVFIPIFIFMSFASGIKLKYIMLFISIGVLTVLFTMLPVWETYIVRHTIPLLQVLNDSRLRTIVTLGSFAVMLVGILGCILFKNSKYFYWIAYISGIICISLISSKIVGLKLKAYQLKRLIIFLNPYVDPKDSGWNIIQSKIAIGAGGFFGRGFLHGTQSHLNYLPEQGTDFIFSILCEEWGFIGGFTVFVLYLIIMLRTIYILKETHSKYGCYIVTGIFGMFFFHFIENIGMVMGLMPITGIPLVFLSYGGSSLWTSMVCIGLVMAVRYRRFNFMD